MIKHNDRKDNVVVLTINLDIYIYIYINQGNNS